MTCKFTNELKTGPICYVSSSKPTTTYPLFKRAIVWLHPDANQVCYKLIMANQQEIARNFIFDEVVGENTIIL